MYFDLNSDGTGTLINCGNDFNYLIDAKTNKKICFKSDEECPKEYSDYEQATKECHHIPCNYESYYKNICTFSDNSIKDVLDKMRELITSYNDKKSNLEANFQGESALEISNEIKELLFEDDTDLPWLDLSTCGEKLKAYYKINDDQSLIILKYGLISDLSYEEELQFEVYDPVSFQKLDLSICNESNINLIISLPLSDEFVNAINNIIDQGYDPFDLNDRFYREICTPYDSENGTDVLLDSREEYYYSSLNNIVCPDHCNTSSFDLDSKYLKC
jgi:hypothetical protein